jgi:hypothetical protein
MEVRVSDGEQLPTTGVPATPRASYHKPRAGRCWVCDADSPIFPPAAPRYCAVCVEQRFDAVWPHELEIAQWRYRPYQGEYLQAFAVARREWLDARQRPEARRVSRAGGMKQRGRARPAWAGAAQAATIFPSGVVRVLRAYWELVDAGQGTPSWAEVARKASYTDRQVRNIRKDPAFSRDPLPRV